MTHGPAGNPKAPRSLPSWVTIALIVLVAGALGAAAFFAVRALRAGVESAANGIMGQTCGFSGRLWSECPRRVRPRNTSVFRSVGPEEVNRSMNVLESRVEKPPGCDQS